MLHKMMTRTWLSIAGDSDEFECEDCGERIYESEAEECETCGRGCCSLCSPESICADCRG
jgi:hypothetical protein